MKIINIEHLSKTYKSGKIALNDISLQVEENTLFGLLGVNGAGKTTLIKILSGLLKKDTGKVTMASFSLDDDIDEIQKIINISPQETSIAPNLTVKENIKLLKYLISKMWKNKKQRHYLVDIKEDCLLQ